ncbi:hypothetical protein D3C80_2009450 [compost metagenome]
MPQILKQVKPYLYRSVQPATEQMAVVVWDPILPMITGFTAVASKTFSAPLLSVFRIRV